VVRLSARREPQGELKLLDSRRSSPPCCWLRLHREDVTVLVNGLTFAVRLRDFNRDGLAADTATQQRLLTAWSSHANLYFRIGDDRVLYLLYRNLLEMSLSADRRRSDAEARAV
jgi:hypothetical protein